MKSGFVVITVLLSIISCQSSNDQLKNMEEKTENQFIISENLYGHLDDSIRVTQYSLKSNSGFEMRILDYGCIMTHLLVPDRNGKIEDVVLGFNDLESYVKNSPYFGCIVGRYGNRIAKGRFTLEGKEYVLAVNNGANHLHGGEEGFDRKMWKGELYNEADRAGVRFTYTSEDGEEGYPGNLSVKFNCYITSEHELGFEYEAITDRTTHCNLTQHNYYNLSGNTKNDILNHDLHINSDTITPVGDGLIPTGRFQAVYGGPFDFTNYKKIGSDINADNDQLAKGGGYDHNYVLIEGPEEMKQAAIVIDSISGRKMEVLTTEPGVQFYSGNFLDGSLTGKYDVVYKRNMGLCLETQHFPDSPNQPNFPSTVLASGEKYHSITKYRFSVIK